MMLFVAGTGTGVGKTTVSVALLEAWVRFGLTPAGVKPIETGCDPHPEDARRLAAACGHPELADLAGLYRAAPPLAPHAIALENEGPTPKLHIVTEAVSRVVGEPVLVEGAGGVLVPLDGTRTVSDLAKRLDAPVLLVAANVLGVLSHTLTAVEALCAREIDVRAIALNDVSEARDRSHRTNAAVLRHHLDLPVFELPFSADLSHDEALEQLARHLVPSDG